MKIVLTTFDDKVQATGFASDLVKSKLAACVNIIPSINSIYFWDGQLKNDQELLLIIKTKTEKLELLEAHFKLNHPYKIYEFVVLNSEKVGLAYSEWLTKYIEST